MDELKATLRTVLSRVLMVVSDAHYYAFHYSHYAKELAEGFVPNLVVTAGRASAVGCAFAGYGMLNLDFVSKFYGKKDCKNCNGWEALRCTSCKGTGTVKYLIVDPGIQSGEITTAENVAKAIVDGRAKLQQFPSTVDVGLFMPSKQCAACDGTGVMKCTECNGDSWKGVFHADYLMNTPKTAINAYKKMKYPLEETIDDPEKAAILSLARRELGSGRPLDEDLNSQIRWLYEDSKRKSEMRDAVARKEPGWEEMQQVLVATDPSGTLEDPKIVKNVSYYKARQSIADEVGSLQVPPRPADWGNMEYPLRESDWHEEELTNPKIREERNILLQAQKMFMEEILDKSWQQDWQQKKIEELTKNKIEMYLRGNAKIEKTSKAKEIKKSETPSPSPSPSPSPAAAAAAAKPEKTAVKNEKEEKRKKERRERAERIARQAAEREAALSKAKSSN